MEVRLALALCVVLCGTLCGRSLSEGARRRAAALRGIIEAVRRLRVRMTGMFEPVQGALQRADCPLFAAVAEAMSGGRSAGEAWDGIRAKAGRRGGPAEFLLEADRETLTQLFDGLGQSGREEQDLLLGSALESLEALHAVARAKAGEADRLYVPLGLLIGLMLALIVI